MAQYLELVEVDSSSLVNKEEEVMITQEMRLNRRVAEPWGKGKGGWKSDWQPSKGNSWTAQGKANGSDVKGQSSSKGKGKNKGNEKKGNRSEDWGNGRVN